jgi:hypothetical protein
MLTFPVGTKIVTVVLGTSTLTSDTTTITGKFVLDAFLHVKREISDLIYLSDTDG